MIRRTDPQLIAGRQLRWFLTVVLFDERELSVPELVARIERAGFAVSGRPSKVVSDALRWEIDHGRVVRRGRGRYGAGAMPRSTLHWRRNRVRALVGGRSGT